MVELVDAATAELASKTKLMRPHAVGNDVGDVVGQVAASFRRR